MQRAKHALRAVTPQAIVLALAVGLVVGVIVAPAASPPVSPSPAVQAAVEAPALPLPATPPAPNCEVLKCLALTFDDGPDAGITPRILDTLKQHNAKATFFVLGGHVQGNEALLKRIHAEGHEIGNHSWNHPRFTQLSLDQVRAEVQDTQTIIAQAGVPAPHIFRPPYGDMSEAVAANIPLSVVRWNVDPEDWRPKMKPRLLEHMAAYAQPGGVVVLHDTESTTADQLDALLTQLNAQGFTLVTVSHIMGLSPGQQGVYFAR